MTPSKPSSQRLEVANTFPGLSLLTWNQLGLMKLDVELIDSCIIPNNSLMARKMLLITMLVVTTPLERRLSILFLTASESWLTLALVFRDSFSSTLSVEVPDLDLHLFSWSVCLLTTARNPSLNLPSTQLLRLPPLLWNLIMLSSPPIPLLSTLTALLWLTMKLSTTSAAGISELRDHPTPTLTD